MRNIETAFQQNRLFSLCFLIFCTIICCYTIYASHRQVALNKGKIYILFNGKLFEAFEIDRKTNIPVEIRDHVKTYHQDFFTLSPNEKVIQENINKALYLVDESGKKQYENLKEAGYYNNVIAGNISQQIKIDSIRLDMSKAPYYFRLFGRLIISRPTSIVTRSLITEGYVRIDDQQSDNNIHGFLIERWAVLENEDLKPVNR